MINIALLKNQFVKMKWARANKKYYIDKGYEFTNFGDEFDVKVEDLTKSNNSIVKVECDYCGKICTTNYKNYNKSMETIQKYSCTNCVGKKCVEITLKNRQEKFYKKLLEQADKMDYTILSSKDEIINNRTYIKYKCHIHGDQTMRISNFLNGKGCNKCQRELLQKTFKFSTKEVEKIISDHGSSILNSEDYINITTKNLKILCPKCNKPFITSLRNFTQHGSQFCPDCSKSSESVGEHKIREYLNLNNIKFISQYWFDDCRDINPLPFDFYIPSKNTLIEFDGSQHFRETNYFSYSYEKTKEHDNIKNTYCKNNNIKLIRIPYWKYDKIEEILNKELNIIHEDIV